MEKNIIHYERNDDYGYDFYRYIDDNEEIFRDEICIKKPILLFTTRDNIDVLFNNEVYNLVGFDFRTTNRNHIICIGDNLRVYLYDLIICKIIKTVRCIEYSFNIYGIVHVFIDGWTGLNISTLTIMRSQYTPNVRSELIGDKIYNIKCRKDFYTIRTNKKYIQMERYKVSNNHLFTIIEDNKIGAEHFHIYDSDLNSIYLQTIWNGSEVDQSFYNFSFLWYEGEEIDTSLYEENWDKLAIYDVEESAIIKLNNSSTLRFPRFLLC